jgi:cold shock protein
VASIGVVREFHPDEGWGVIDGPDVPGGCWVHFSAIAMDGYRQLAPAQRVTFRAEAAEQDGFGFRAVQVWTGAVEPVRPPLEQDSFGSAYGSALILTLDEPGDLDES